MSDIDVTAAQVKAIFPRNAEIYNVIAAETITKGLALYQNNVGTFGIADANASGKQQFRGIALTTAVSGTVVSILKRGFVAGFTLPDSDDIIYLSDTAGALADAAGTMTVNVGRVSVLTDKPTYTEVLYIDAQWREDWS